MAINRNVSRAMQVDCLMDIFFAVKDGKTFEQACESVTIPLPNRSNAVVRSRVESAVATYDSVVAYLKKTSDLEAEAAVNFFSKIKPANVGKSGGSSDNSAAIRKLIAEKIARANAL
jgi:hypothetical protein